MLLSAVPGSLSRSADRRCVAQRAALCLLISIARIRKTSTAAVMEGVASNSEGLGEGGFLSEEVSTARTGTDRQQGAEVLTAVTSTWVDPEECHADALPLCP